MEPQRSTIDPAPTRHRWITSVLTVGSKVLTAITGVRADGTERRRKALTVGGLFAITAALVAFAAVRLDQPEPQMRRILSQGVEAPGLVDANEHARSSEDGSESIRVCVTYAYEAEDYLECPSSDHRLEIGSKVTVKFLPHEPGNPVVVGDVVNSNADVVVGALLIAAAITCLLGCWALVGGAVTRRWRADRSG